MRRLIQVPVLATLLALGFSGTALADTITVNTTSDAAPSGAECSGVAGDCSLRQAIDKAGPGDTVQLASADYGVTLGSDIEIAKSLVIAGNGVGNTSIDGSQNNDGNAVAVHRILRIDPGAAVTIQDLTLTGGDDGADEVANCGGPCRTVDTNGGGALWNDNGTVVVTRVAFTGNSNTGAGGAVSNTGGSLTMTDVSFTDNQGAVGAALFTHSGSVTGDGVTFENDGTGCCNVGAVYLLGGTVSFVNTTVVGGGGPSSIGGGIHNEGAQLTLVNDTLSGNTRGSLQTDGRPASTSVENTIIGKGSAGDCVAAGSPDGAVDQTTAAAAITTDLGNNIDEDGSCGLTKSTDFSKVDAHLASIADNGGPTRTQALLFGSPAFGAGNEQQCPSTDQRGQDRGNPCDIGAFDAPATGPQPSASTEDATNIQETQADLLASIDFGGEAGGLHFLWGTSADALNNVTSEVGEGVVDGSTEKSQTLQGLQPGTTYYYKAVADNASGSATSSIIKAFTTPAGAPTISNVTAEPPTDTTAKIDFTIDPQGADTTYYVKYGTDALTQQSDPATAPASSGPQNYSVTLSNLQPGTTYFYEVVASNNAAPDGVKSSEDTLTTAQQVRSPAGIPVTVTDSGTAGSCPSQATVDWGDDGPTSQAHITCSSGSGDQTDYQVSAAHVYGDPGHFRIQISYPDFDQVVDEYAQIASGQSRTPAISQSQVSADFYASDPNSSNPGNFFSDWPGSPALWTQSFPIINFNDDPTQDPPGFCPAPSGNGAPPFTDGISLNPSANTNCSYVVAQNGDGTLQAGQDTSLESGGRDLTQFTSVMTGTYTVDGPGQVTFNSLSDDGFSFGIGPSDGGEQPIYTSGSNDMPSGSTAVNGYDVVGSDQGSHSPGGDTFTVYFPTAGTYPFELDYDECCSGQLEMTLTVNSTVLQAPTLATSATADQSTVTPGQQDGYSVTISNPTSSAATLTDIEDTLPSGFSYVAGSSSGVTSADPSTSGQTLTWTGSFSVPANGAVSLHFKVLAPSTAGGPFYDAATGDADGGYAVVPAGHAAPITVASSSPAGGSGQGQPSTGSSPTSLPPTVGGGAPSIRTSTGASPSGTVNPEGLATQAFFEYGLDLAQRGPGADTTLYDQKTAPQTVGADTSDHTITASLSGLIPGALYHVRLVATSAAGTTFGADQTFTTAAAPAPPPPVLGQTQDVKPISGAVFIKLKNGQFIPLTGATQIPSGSVIDALHGSLQVIAALGKGKTEQGIFGGAIFKITQAHSGLVNLSLVEAAFKGAPSYALCHAHKAADATIASTRTLQLLKASAHGKFRTTGRYSAATVRGTTWTIADRCDGTLTHDITHSVAVTDFVRHKTIILHAGQSYLALAKPPHNRG